jgi:hypothetical protein
MHGKPFRTTHYGQDQDNKELETILQQTTYSYYEGDIGVKQELGQYKQYRTLKNDLPALIEYGIHPTESSNMDIQSMEFGVEREFFTDVRSAENIGASIGTGPNVVFSILASIFGFPIPLPGVFVSATFSENITRTIVANKIVRKSGMLKQIDVFDGQSSLKTNNLVFDKITGEPVLTSVNNSFDSLVYSLQIPAHYSYEGMGPAFENYRLHFNLEIESFDSECTFWQRLTNIDPAVRNLLKPDDELLLLDNLGDVVATFTIPS